MTLVVCIRPRVVYKFVIKVDICFSGLLPEVLKTTCKSCSQNDKENLRKFLRRVQLDPKLSDAWKEVMAKYDPHRQYEAGLEKFVKEG